MLETTESILEESTPITVESPIKEVESFVSTETDLIAKK